MASVSEMRALVNEQRAIQRRLQSELYELENGVSNAENKWNQITNYVNNTLITSQNRVNNSHELALKAYEIQCDIEKIYKLYKYVESANKKIRELQNKIYYDFANYNAVRKIVESMLNNIEVSFVKDSILTKAIEIKHLQLPDYWLTCALLSIMAWRNDDRPMAEKALERACQLDMKNTSVFFFAFHLRMDRNGVALKWLKNYVNCELTGTDNVNILFMFSLLSKSAEKDCDDKLYNEISDFVDKTIQNCLSDEGYSEKDMVSRISRYLKAMSTRDLLKYPVLNKYCKESGLYSEILSSAKNNVNILEFVRKVIHISSVEKKNRINSFIDDVIRRSNSSETDIRNEIYHNKLIIKHGGEKEAADKEYDEWIKHNVNQLNIISEMIEWVYNPGDTDVSSAEKQRIFIMTSNLSKKAVDKNVQEYRDSMRNQADIEIGEYKTKADLTNESSEHQKIDGYFTQKAAILRAQQKIWPSFVWFGAAVLGAVGAVALSMQALFVVTAAGIIGGIGHLLMTSKRKKNITRDCMREAQVAKEIFSRISGEFKQYIDEYKSFDKYYDDITEEFNSI